MQPTEEPRSFAPREDAESEPVKTTPIDPRHATLAAIARGHNKLHECLDQAREDIATATNDIAEMKDALGLGRGGKKVAGLSTKWAAFRRNVMATTSSIIACGIIYKIAVLVAPGLVLIWTALSAAMLKGIF